MRPDHRRSFHVIATLAICCLAAAPARAANWRNSAGGSWLTPSNWSLNTVPTTTTDTFFNRGIVAPDFSAYAGYTVTFPGPSTYTVHTLSVQIDKVTLALAGSALTLQSSPLDNPKPVGLSVGTATDEEAYLTVAGGMLSTYSALIGANAASGTVTVATGGTLYVPGGSLSTFAVGATGGTGNLNVVSGGHAGVDNYAIIGTFGGRGNLLVDGPGSAFSVSVGEIDIGRGSNFSSGTFVPSNGTVSVTNGGQFFTENVGLGFDGGTGAISVDGPGSKFHVAYLDAGGIPPYPGGHGTISVTNGASYTVGGTQLHQGPGNAILVDGPGTTFSSALQIETGSLLVSHGATVTTVFDYIVPALSLRAGTITASSGASLNNAYAATLGFSGGTASVTLSSDSPASPSVWSNTGAVYLGDNAAHSSPGTATLTLAPGGRLACSSTVTLAPSTTLSLTGGSLAASAVLYAGTITGSGPIDADLSLDPSAVLLLSLFPSSYDRLTSIHAITFGGTLAVSLAPAYTPAPGDAFDLLDFATRDGSSTFSTLSLPPLPPGLSWDTSSLYSTGTLAVTAAVPEPALFSLLPTLLLARRRT